ncbi:hypothetical protein BGZ60DRAFT_515112 [Tricladium varicosporioides]|nr:hypothetical protein BGZ60DRAFT_515112 [Hymenoscyphus varicosporioides]
MHMTTTLGFLLTFVAGEAQLVGPNIICPLTAVRFQSQLRRENYSDRPTLTQNQLQATYITHYRTAMHELHLSKWGTPLKVVLAFSVLSLFLMIFCVAVVLLRNYYPNFFKKLKFWSWGKGTEEGLEDDLEAALPLGEGQPIRMVDGHRGGNNQVILGRCPMPPEPLSREDMRVLMMLEEQQKPQQPRKAKSESRSSGAKKGMHGNPVDDSEFLRRYVVKKVAKAVCREELCKSFDSDPSLNFAEDEQEFVNVSRTRPPGSFDNPARATFSSSSFAFQPVMISMTRTRSSSLGFSTQGKRKAIQRSRGSVSELSEAPEREDITLSSLNLPGPELSIKLASSNELLEDPYTKSEE